MACTSTIAIAVLIGCLSGLAQETTDSAQVGETKSEDLERLIDDLERAHHPGGGDHGSFDQFEARFLLETLGVDSESISVDTHVKFLLQEREEGDRPLIQTEIQGGEQPIERGRDSRGYWQRADGITSSLAGRDSTGDREGVQRDANFAMQLTRYLDPATVVRRLRGVRRVEEENLRTGRGRKPILCRTIAGVLDAFPFYYLAGDRRPARIKLWVDDATGMLLAVQAEPLGRLGQPMPQHGEFFRLSGHHPIDGVLLPRTVAMYQLEPTGRRIAKAKVEFMSLDLRPGLTVEGMRRPL